jgi:hypothetical protein
MAQAAASDRPCPGAPMLLVADASPVEPWRHTSIPGGSQWSSPADVLSMVGLHLPLLEAINGTRVAPRLHSMVCSAGPLQSHCLLVIYFTRLHMLSSIGVSPPYSDNSASGSHACRLSHRSIFFLIVGCPFLLFPLFPILSRLDLDSIFLLLYSCLLAFF